MFDRALNTLLNNTVGTTNIRYYITNSWYNCDFFALFYVSILVQIVSTNKYLLNVNKINIRKRCEI